MRVHQDQRPEARQQAIEAYLAFTNYINSYRLVIVGAAGNESLDQFIDLVNSIIARFERVVLRNKPSKPEDATPGDGDEGDGSDVRGLASRPRGREASK